MGNDRGESDRGKSENAMLGPVQVDVNRAVYESPSVYRHYSSVLLTPSEIGCLLKYQQYVSGRDVLDVGVGTGRTTRYLIPLAKRYEAIDYSSVMVRYMKTVMPEVSVQQADFRDLGIFSDGSFDFVFAPNNVIDALSHEGRLQALSEARRVLRPDGLLAFSSHNIRYKKAFLVPQLKWSSNPARLASNCAHYLLCWWNYLRLTPLRRTTADYALLNDEGHHYATLHYYAARLTVSAQLTSVGMQLSAVFNTLGKLTPEDMDDSDNPSLLYVAKRAAD